MTPRRPTTNESLTNDALMYAHGTQSEVIVRSFEDLSDEQRVVNRNVLQLEVLSLFGKLNQKEHLFKNQQLLERRYGNGSTPIFERLKEQHTAMNQRAAEAFFDSCELDAGKAALIAEGATDRDIQEFERRVRRDWNRFQTAYRSPEHRGDRAQKAKQLRDEIKIAQSTDNRDKKLRPHLIDQYRKERALPKLSTRQRMVAIHEDPRAGFYPTTNQEKNIVLSWLDYLDNPEYPLGTTNQLLEVFNHQARLEYKGQYGKALPARTVRSILYELQDYYANARYSLDGLTKLDAIVDDIPNPRITIAEEIDSHPGLAPLVRHRDIAAFVVDGKQADHGRPVLITREDRRIHEDPQKNKTVEDIYTRREMDIDGIAEYLTAELDSSAFKIGKVRPLIKEAIAHQEARSMFWYDRLVELSQTVDSRTHNIAGLAARLLVSDAIKPLSTSA